MTETLPTLPKWLSQGVEPPEVLKTNGWSPGTKPPAQYMDWLFNRIYECLIDLYTKVNGEDVESRLDDIEEILGDFTDIETPQITNIVQAITDLRTQITQHKDESLVKTAVGTATALTIPIANLVEGYNLTFIASANNNASATTINGKPLYKPNTTTVPKLILGKAYTVWYSATSDAFFIKASAEGDALTNHVLADKTFSNDDDTGLLGTMPNRGTFNLGLGATVPAGYYSGGSVPTGVLYASGNTTTDANGRLQVVGLTFRPTAIIVIVKNNISGQTQWRRYVYQTKIRLSEYSDYDAQIHSTNIFNATNWDQVFTLSNLGAYAGSTTGAGPNLENNNVTTTATGFTYSALPANQTVYYYAIS